MIFCQNFNFRLSVCIVILDVEIMFVDVFE